MCNDFLAVEFSEERLYIMFGDVIVRRVALGLHRPVLAVLVLKHEVNAAVHALALRPFIPQPHLLNLGSPFGGRL